MEEVIAFDHYSNNTRPVEFGQPIKSKTLVRLRQWMVDEQIEIGTRLPPERQLAHALAVTRPDLRKALMILEAEGRITRHVGRGTFLAAPPRIATARSAINNLADRTSPHEAMMARQALEPQLANLAAMHATPRQITRARKLSERIRAATGWSDYEKLDFELHDLIAEASGNTILHELHMILNVVRQTVVWRNLAQDETGPAPDYHSFDEHDAIIAAIAKRDSFGAQAAMRAHLLSTMNAMITPQS